MGTKKKRNRSKGGNGAAAKPQPPDVVAAAHDVGARLLAGFRDELNILKNPGNAKQTIWGTLSEIQQEEILERYGRRIEHELVRGYQAILANGFPAVHAHLDKVAFSSKGIQGVLMIPRGSSHRHALADFADSDVLVVLAEDLDEYLESMKLVKPDRDQKELELAGADTPEEIVDEDPRTLEDLRKAAVAAAASIEEKDIDVALVGTWGREHCLDYLAWAAGDKALPGDHPAGAGAG